MAKGEKIAAHIGCAKCKTALFVLVAVPTGNRGVFQNEMRPVGGVAADADTKFCADCGGPLSRVAAPA